MSDMFKIADFLSPLDMVFLSGDLEYHDGQTGKHIEVYDESFPDISEADVVIVGCPEQRGAGPSSGAAAPDHVRQEFYRLYNWHTSLRVADIGNVRIGAALKDTYAALRTVIAEIVSLGKTLLVLGGSHDLSLAQYYACSETGKLIEAATVDAKIDLNMNSPFANDHFLMEMLTGEPNFIRHYSHIGFQSYLVHPYMLETLDKLHFDCYRVGKVRENIEEMEPVVRHADIFSFDISAIANAYAPSNTISPNGFTGDEACAIMRYVGMSPANRSAGIFGYDPATDRDHLTAKQISQMIWYFLEGRNRGKREPSIHEREGFNEFHIAFAEVATTFLQSKRTGRWWMQLPDQQYIACSYNDYIQASSNEVPERWLRAQERNV